MKILSIIQNFFSKKNELEVDTPVDKKREALKKEFDKEFDEFLCTREQHDHYFEWFCFKYAELENYNEERDSLIKKLSARVSELEQKQNGKI